ncbi:MAG: transcriptional regulator [archaeon GBS-70-058]|nr:transcriptional regulator [Candidatus Culexarchaeum nevadense]
MKTPLEIGYRYVLPSLKSQLTKILTTKFNLNQIEASKTLKISKSTVSRYLSMERGSKIDMSKFSDVNEILEKLASKILVERLDEYSIEMELIKITLHILSKRYLCNFHAEIDPQIDPAKCNICSKIFKQI